MIDSQFNRLVLKAGIDWARQQCDVLERQLATHSPECDAKPEPVVRTAPAKKEKTLSGWSRRNDPEFQKVLAAIETGLRDGATVTGLMKKYHVATETIHKVRKKLGLPSGHLGPRPKVGHPEEVTKAPVVLVEAKPKVVKKKMPRGWARLKDPAYLDLCRKVKSDIASGARMSVVKKRYGVCNATYYRLKKELGVVRDDRDPAQRLPGIPIIATADPDAIGSSGFCKCGSVIKDRLLQKYGGDIIHQSVCGSCHRPIEECTCRKILIPPIPLAVREGARP